MPAGQAIDPNVWDDTLQRLFAQLSELPCYWRDRERPYTDPYTNALCLLSVPSIVSWGVDERRLTVDDTKLASDPPEEIIPEQNGLRRLVLQVQVDTYNQDAKERARFYLERIRLRLRRPSARATLTAIQCSLIDIGPTVLVGHNVDNRTYSRATMDVAMHTTAVERDGAFGRIVTVEGDGAVTDESGQVVKPVPYQVNLEP